MVKNQWPPYSQLNLTFHNLIRTIKVLTQGENVFVESKLKAQAGPIVGYNSPIVIETAKLPLNINIMNLPSDFPVAGGALAEINDQLVVMTRTGEFFLFHHDNFNKLDLGNLPNKIRDFIIHSNAPLTSDNFRAHSFTYDATDRKLYVSHTTYIAPNLNRFDISAIRINPLTLNREGEWENVFSSEPISSKYSSQAGGGRIIKHGEMIYFSVGYADESTGNATTPIPGSQNLSSSFGKIFQLNLKTHKTNIFSLGHRNVQGLTVTKEGDILSTEHGPQGGDEINLLKQGGNYGWPYKTYGTDYGSYKFNSGWSQPDNFLSEEPLYAFVPSVGLSPVTSINDFHPEWNGNVLAGSLKSQSLFRLVYKQGRIILSEPIWIGHRIRDISQIAKGRIALLTDDSLLIFITVNENYLKNDTKNAGYNFEPKLQRCLACHHFEQSNPSSMAPSLANINGRKIGADTYQSYSTALKNTPGVWTEESLTKFIKNPNDFIPGTTMPSLGLSDEESKTIAKILAK